jgi:HAD hydrolase, family IA, variant 1
MIKAVILDLDDTLYSYSELNEQGISKICKYTCQKLKIKKEKFYEAFDKAKKDVKITLEGVASSHNRLLYCQKTLENLNENPFSIALEMYEIYWQHILKNMKLNANVLEVLKFCKHKKIKIGICTDLTVHIQHRKIRKLGIDEYVDAIVTSEEVGVEKPDFKMYNKILEKLDVTPGEALFVGDSLKKDVLGSMEYGMKALWYSKTDNNKYQSIQNFNELLEILKK